jgi:hypothetical protein
LYGFRGGVKLDLVDVHYYRLTNGKIGDRIIQNMELQGLVYTIPPEIYNKPFDPKRSFLQVHIEFDSLGIPGTNPFEPCVPDDNIGKLIITEWERDCVRATISINLPYSLISSFTAFQSQVFEVSPRIIERDKVPVIKVLSEGSSMYYIDDFQITTRGLIGNMPQHGRLE